MKRLIVNLYAKAEYRSAAAAMISKMLSGHHLPSYPYDLAHIKVNQLGIEDLHKFTPPAPLGGMELKVIIRSKDFNTAERKALSNYVNLTKTCVKSFLIHEDKPTSSPNIVQTVVRYDLLELDLTNKIIAVF